MQEHRDMPTHHEHRRSWENFYREHKNPWRVNKYYGIEIYIDKGSLILDLCSGTGNASRPLVEKGYSVVLLDFSMNSLRRSGGGEYARVLGDATALPFRDSSFDAIIASHAISHLLEEERRKAVSEIYRVSKENAILVFEAFTTGDFRYGKGVEIERNTFLRGNGIYTHYFTEDELNSLFKEWHIFEKNIRHVERKIFGSIYKMETLVFIAKINKNKKVFIHARHYE
ncbi:MAG: class I SAM-dependent methyltransferase [Thermoplasmata archaeon]|jgi:ubiquinone/menaquinone biosynthesis C-methylase UbiE|nr:class I SAM-dependent methyltransferase [Thermoplasmatales archaeon]PMP73750.1 MAG: class I SAM-dependent methyltransferase [Aciduliprofundum sp.]HEU13125.1 class I SAM-dependent methyltransferase [Euryarchaeota archaeon]